MRVRALAAGLRTQIGAVMEHIVGLGMEYLCLRLERGQKEQAQEIEQLREHLEKDHIGVDQLQHSEEILLTPDSLSGERAEEYHAIQSLVLEYQREGVPHTIVIQMLNRFYNHLQHQRRRDEVREKLRHTVDLQALRQLHAKYPRLIKAIYGLLEVCSSEELVEILEDHTPRRRRRRK